MFVSQLHRVLQKGKKWEREKETFLKYLWCVKSVYGLLGLLLFYELFSFSPYTAHRSKEIWVFHINNNSICRVPAGFENISNLIIYLMERQTLNPL